MDAIEQVKKLITQMDETQRQACLHLLKKTESEDETLKKNITANIEKLKAGFAELSIDDWEAFYRRLHGHCHGIKKIWRMIDRRRELARQARSSKRQEYVERMLDQGFQFDLIVIEGEPFEVVNGKVSSKIVEDNIPF